MEKKQDGVKLLENMKEILIEYFGPMTAWMHFKKTKSKLHICEDCKRNILFNPKDLKAMMTELYETTQGSGEESCLHPVVPGYWDPLHHHQHGGQQGGGEG